ncbi:MAG: NnrS family protein [Betaproteobacteria bacterium]|nr:NnrS family protein [Betaproteobacteria bacterium]
MPLIRLDEPTVRPKTPPRGFSLFALAFRPFYMLGAIWAMLAIPLWLAQYGGLFSLPTPGLYWHAHEMIFGFAAAIIVGFLFTAGQNWTGLATSTGKPLAVLALCWVAGRIAMLWGPSLITAIIDLAFLPLAAIALGRILWRAKSKRNYFTIAILLGLSLANLMFHLRLNEAGSDPMPALHTALTLIALLTTIIAGRIVPSFTANALRGIKQFKNTALNWGAIGFTAGAFILNLLEASAPLLGGVAALAAILQAVRCWGWNPWATRQTPLLWILHLAHAWIPIGLALLALAAFGLAPASLAWHAFAVGTVGGLILGMITRTALGHTGRLLKAGRIETAAYALVLIAAAIRVFGILLWPAQTRLLLDISGCCWTIAFALYLWRYAPMLWHPRIDGKSG